MSKHPSLGLVDVFAATLPTLTFTPGVHVNYAETVLPMRDGLPKLKDFPKERFASDLQGWHSDHPYLTRAIDEARPAIVVEVGVWKGASVVTMAKEIKRLGLDAVVIAIDTWLGSSEHYLWEKFIPDLDFEFGYPRLYHKFAANICKADLQDFVVPLALDSINAFQLLKTQIGRAHV